MFNDNANDNLGNFNGLPSGVTNTTGIYNGAYNFDGVDDLINITTTNTITEGAFNSSTGSLSAWFKVNDGANGYILSSSDEDANNNYTGMYTANGRVVFFYKDPTGDSNSITTSAYIYNDTWYHTVITADGSQWRLYIDGKDVTTLGSGSNLGKWFGDIEGRDNVVIGARKQSAAPGLFFDGTIDNVMIWNSTLTQQDVYKLYRSGYEQYINTTTYLNNITWSGTATASVLESNPAIGNETMLNNTDMVGYWKLNGNALDETNNNNDGKNTD